MSNCKLSILIPSWNGEIYIENCLSSLLENDYDNVQIITIAGGIDQCYDISLKFQEKYHEKIIALKQEIGNKNRALNIGLAKADGDIIILTDVDCMYPKNWLKKINEIFQNTKINVITGLSLPFQHVNNSLAEFNRIRVGYKLVNFPDGQIIIGNKLSGCNSAFRKEIFCKKIGSFNETLKTGEDKILGIEFNKKGEELYYFRDIYIYTEYYSNDLRKLIKHRIRWAKDLFIKLKFNNVPKLLFLLGIGLFKLFYPIFGLSIWIFFFHFSIFNLLLILSPWLIFFLLWVVIYYFNLRFKTKKVNERLGSNFNHIKAYKIVPLMFFVFGIISVKSFINPKKKKWDHSKYK